MMHIMFEDPWNLLSWKKVKDSIYGYVYFNEIEKVVVDNPFVQRLRYIYQTQLTRLVYPAEHSRFLHSLGVMHLTGIAAYKILLEIKREESKRKSSLLDNRVLNTMLLASRIAGLLHDVGQIFMSHWTEELLDQVVPPRLRPYGSHEELGLILYENFISNKLRTHVNNIIGEKGFPLNVKMLDYFIRALLRPLEMQEVNYSSIRKIVKEGVKCEYNKYVKYLVPLYQVLKIWLYTTDELDYLMRDGKAMEVLEYGTIDWRRLIYETSVSYFPEKDTYILAVRNWRRFLPAFLRFLEAFILMYRFCYFHRTVKAFERVLHELYREHILNFLDALSKIIEGGNEGEVLRELYKFTDAVQLKRIIVDRIGRFGDEIRENWAKRMISREPPVKLLLEINIHCRNVEELNKVMRKLRGLRNIMERYRESEPDFNIRLHVAFSEFMNLNENDREKLIEAARRRHLLMGGFYIALPHFLKYDNKVIFPIKGVSEEIKAIKLDVLMNSFVIPAYGKVPILIKFLAFYEPRISDNERRRLRNVLTEGFTKLREELDLVMESIFPIP